MDDEGGTVRLKVTRWTASCLAPPHQSILSEGFQPLPMPLDPGMTEPGQTEPGYGYLADELLLDPHEPALLEPGEVARKISFAQSGQPLQIEEVGAAARGQRGQDRQARGLMNQPVELRELLKRSTDCHLIRQDAATAATQGGRARPRPCRPFRARRKTS